MKPQNRCFCILRIQLKELVWASKSDGIIYYEGFPHSSVGKESTCNAGDPGLIPGSGRSTGEGIWYPLQYSRASLVAQLVKNLPEMWETWVWSCVRKIPWRRERLPTAVLVHGVAKRHNWATFTFTFLLQPFVHITSIAVIRWSSSYIISCPSLSSLWASWKQRSCLIYIWIFKHLAQCSMLIELSCTDYLWCPSLEGKKKASL